MSIDSERVASVLDRAGDELLIHGWTQQFLETTSGQHCILGAISCALNHRDAEGRLQYPDTCEVGFAAFDAILDVLPRRKESKIPGLGVAYWNDEDDRTLDDVLDLLRLASKKLREDAA